MMAMHHYDNSQCVNIAEFEEDIKRFGYLKKLFYRYKESGELKERLILNHIIILYNLFGIATTDLLFYKIDRQYWNILATFLVFLELAPEELPYEGFKLTDFQLDQKIIEELRKI